MALEFETVIEHHEYEKMTVKFDDSRQEDSPVVEIEVHDQDERRGNSRIYLTANELRGIVALADKYDAARKALGLVM